MKFIFKRLLVLLMFMVASVHGENTKRTLTSGKNIDTVIQEHIDKQIQEQPHIKWIQSDGLLGDNSSTSDAIEQIKNIIRNPRNFHDTIKTVLSCDVDGLTPANWNYILLTLYVWRSIDSQCSKEALSKFLNNPHIDFSTLLDLPEYESRKETIETKLKESAPDTEKYIKTLNLYKLLNDISGNISDEEKVAYLKFDPRRIKIKGKEYPKGIKTFYPLVCSFILSSSGETINTISVCRGSAWSKAYDELFPGFAVLDKLADKFEEDPNAGITVNVSGTYTVYDYEDSSIQTKEREFEKTMNVYVMDDEIHIDNQNKLGFLLNDKLSRIIRYAAEFSGEAIGNATITKQGAVIWLGANLKDRCLPLLPLKDFKGKIEEKLKKLPSEEDEWEEWEEIEEVEE